MSERRKEAEAPATKYSTAKEEINKLILTSNDQGIVEAIK